MPGFRIRFLPHQKAGVFPPRTSFRDAALDLGILLESTCAGIGTCGKCKVEIKSGAEPPTQVERTVLSHQEIEKGVRLSCQALLSDEADCIIPEASLSVIENISTEGMTGEYELEPDVGKFVLDLPKPGLGSAPFLADAACRSLAQSGVPNPRLDVTSLQSLSAATPTGWGCVTADVDDDWIIGFEEGDTSGSLYGVAVDIGTTTLAAKLIDLKSDRVLAVAASGNPQTALGADVVARIQYTIRHAGGLRKLGKLVTSRIDEMIVGMIREAGLKRTDIKKIVLVGNTAMQHLVLGIDPRHLGVKPYTATYAGPVTFRAVDLGLRAAPTSAVYSAPNLSSYVGSDITSVLVALRVRQSSRPILVIDMGTNGEMVATDGKRIVCCSSPAGPAWEGACIRWGMRASRGAIERFEILDGRVEIRTIGESEPVGICGSGLIDVVCSLVRLGIVDPSGRLRSGDEIAARHGSPLGSRIIESDGMRQFVVAEVEDGHPITLTQGDIRQVQLAKAGIAAGIETLLRRLSLQASYIDKALIAGAFGNHLDGGAVEQIGLLPGIAAENIHFVGNAAMSGAEAMLRSRTARLEAEELAGQIEYVEVAAEPEFQDVFVDAIPFPELKNQSSLR